MRVDKTFCIFLALELVIGPVMSLRESTNGEVGLEVALRVAEIGAGIDAPMSSSILKYHQ